MGEFSVAAHVMVHCLEVALAARSKSIGESKRSRHRTQEDLNSSRFKVHFKFHPLIHLANMVAFAC